MMGIRQQELDKAFVQGVLKAEAAILQSRFIGDRVLFKEAAKAIHDVIIAEIGEERYEALAGENSKEPRA